MNGFGKWLAGFGMLMFAALAAVGCTAAEVGVPLVTEGESRAAIVLPAEPHEYEQQAADEIVEHIESITGTALAVVAVGDEPEGLTLIHIGGAADEALEELILAQGDMPDSFVMIVDVEERIVHLRGLSPLGTRHAAYELLEQLGVRWFMPGETGRVLPDTHTLALHEQQNVQVPSFKTRDQRSGNWDETWAGRVRENRGHGHGRSRPGRHSTGGSPDRSEQPEYWGMREDGSRGAGQLCLTGSHDNPDDPSDPEQNYVLRSVIDHYLGRVRDMSDEELSERIVFNTGPRDGGGYCLCEMCKALDPAVTTPFRTPLQSYTDRYVWFYNQVSKAIAEEFPDADVLFGFYAYGGLMHPPEDVEPRGNLAISVAPIHLCRIHGPNNPICPESDYYTYMLETWEPYVEEVWCRGYTWNLADPQFPFPLVHRLREEIPLNHRYGMVGFGTDANHSWATHVPANYIQAKLMWNHEADVDALMADFYEKFYGPASEAMGAYHELLEATIRDADHHTGASWDIPNIYPVDVRSEARSLIEEAAHLAADHDNDLYATRIEILRKNLDMLDAFCDLMDHRHNFEFEAEYEALQALEAARDSLNEDYEYPMLSVRLSNRMVERFIRPITQANYETMAGGAEMVAPLDHQWQFHQDPEEWGQYIGLHKPESEGGNWQTIRTDTSWSNQGLRYYFGQTWYRQTVDVPEGFEDREIRIWFSGVDRTAEAWVNGQWVGANHDGAEFDLDAHGSAFRPFEFDATDAVRHGEPNVVTVRSYRTGTSELGTGGLVGPVMFYASAAE